MTENENRPGESLTGSECTPIVPNADDHGDAAVMDEADARQLTDEIKAAVQVAWELIVMAYEEHAWRALGYDSWDTYCIQEFGTSRLKVPREERSELVLSLRQHGLKIEDIASATGLGYGTVHRELNRPDPSEYPNGYSHAVEEGDDVEEVEAEVVEPTPVPRPPQPGAVTPRPRRHPITDTFRENVSRLVRTVERLDELTFDDRFARNAKTIAIHRDDLEHCSRLLPQIVERLPRIEPPETPGMLPLVSGKAPAAEEDD